MTKVRVLILYEPMIFADLFRCIFERLAMVDVLQAADLGDSPTIETLVQQGRIDVVILPLDHRGQPRIEILPDLLSGAKLLALSPNGEKGLRRLPWENSWQELSPFGLADLMFEVLRTF
jgi:hypothetical protein